MCRHKYKGKDPQKKFLGPVDKWLNQERGHRVGVVALIYSVKMKAKSTKPIKNNQYDSSWHNCSIWKH